VKYASGANSILKSYLDIICVVFRTDSVSYSDVILRVSVLKIARLKWLGHLMGMEDNAPCGKTTPSHPENSGKKGRLRIRKLDSV